MISGSDTETSSKVVGNGPDGRLQVKWGPECHDTSNSGNANNEEDIEPVDVFVPVLLGDGSVGDVRPGRRCQHGFMSWRRLMDNGRSNSLLGVVGLVAVRLRLAGHWGWLLNKVGVDCHHAGGRLVRRHGAGAMMRSLR